MIDVLMNSLILTSRAVGQPLLVTLCLSCYDEPFKLELRF
jgi:hypothetical protein